MHQDSAVCAGPQCRDDIDVTYLGEFVTLLRETLDVIMHGFPLLLPATLQISGIARPHVCALKVAGEDLLEILPKIDRVSGQVIKPSFGHVAQVNGEELNDEVVIIHPDCPACEVVVLHPNTGIGLAVILDNVSGCPKMHREACVMHVAPERFRSWSLRAKAVLFSTAMPTVM
jgi:hypothetical protein